MIINRIVYQELRPRSDADIAEADGGVSASLCWGWRNFKCCNIKGLRDLTGPEKCRYCPDSNRERLRTKAESWVKSDALVMANERLKSSEHAANIW